MSNYVRENFHDLLDSLIMLGKLSQLKEHNSYIILPIEIGRKNFCDLNVLKP